MKRAILLLLLLLSGAGLVAADSWAVLEPMFTPRHGTVSATACNAIFTIAGSSGSANEAFDPVTNSWRIRTNMPITRSGVSGGAVNGKIYVFGGTTNGDLNYEYDPSTDAWSARAPMPTARYEIASAVVSGRIFAIGGKVSSGVTAAMEIYDPATDTWSSGPSMPTPRAAACAALVGSKIYVMGGYTAAMQFLNTHEVYDTLTRAWTTAASMPTIRGCHAGAVIGPLIYAVSGYNGSTHLDVNEVYDTRDNTWQTKAPIPTSRKGAGCAVLGDKIYVIGGSNSEYLRVCEEYTPDIIGIDEEAEHAGDDPGFEAMMAGRQVILSARRATGSRSQITLIDITGRRIAEWDRTITRSMRLRSGTVFPKGVYFLRVQNQDLDIVIKTICVK